RRPAVGDRTLPESGVNPVFGGPRRGGAQRVRPGAKLLGLLAFAVMVVAAPGAWATLGLLVAAVVVALIAGVRVRELARALRVFALVALALLAFQTWYNGLE